MATGEGVGFSNEEQEIKELIDSFTKMSRDWLIGVLNGHDLSCTFCI